MPEDSPKPAFRTPLGIVLPGGGSLGAWQAAALERLARTHGLEFAHVLGFSIGSLNGAGYALDRLDLLMDIWRGLDKFEVMKVSPQLFPPAIFSNKPIWEFVAQGGSDLAAARRTRCDFTVIVTRLEDGAYLYSKYSPRAKNGWDAPIAAYLVASCAIPLIFPPVKVPTREGVKSCVDGGVVLNGYAVSFGALADCRDVIVLDMVRPEEAERADEASGLLGKALAKARAGLVRYTETGLAPLRALPAPPRIFQLRPSRILDYNMLSFRPEHVLPALELGARDADEFVRDPLQYLV